MSRGLLDSPAANDVPPSATSNSPEFVDAPRADQVGALARKGAMWTFAQTIGIQFISIASTPILARLLLPKDYGIMGMVATLTALLAAVSGMGLSWSTIQRKDLTHTQVHNLFWISGALGLVLWGGTAAASPLLADFYNQPELTAVATAMGGTFAISGFANQPFALMSRQMRFSRIAQIELAAGLVTAVVAVGLAMSGWAYWALVVGALANQATRLVLAVVLSGYRPGRMRRDPATMAMVSFGGYLVLTNVVIYVTRNVDNILVGKVWGTEALGYYSRAYFLMTLPAGMFTGSLNGVMVPALSALANEPARLGSAYRTAIKALAFGGFPVAIGIAVTAPESVRLIYGPGWGPVAPLLAIFSVAMVTQIIGGTRYWLFTSAGRSRLQFTLSVAMTVLTVVTMLFVIRFGPIGVAAGYTIVSGVMLLPTWWIAHASAKIAFAPTLAVLLPAFGVATCMGVASSGAGFLAGSVWDDWRITLAVKVTVGIVVYGILAVRYLVPWPIAPLERVRSRLVSAVFGRRASCRNTT